MWPRDLGKLFTTSSVSRGWQWPNLWRSRAIWQGFMAQATRSSTLPSAGREWAEVIESGTASEEAPRPEWPQLAALAQLQESSWTESTAAQSGLRHDKTTGAMFQYGPIAPNQIRLLCLIPASSPNEELTALMMVCNFPKISLDGWHALSYTWGNPNDLSGVIVINGGKMMITPNLEKALRDVRNQDAVPYWVDAICINQADPVEKAHQIRHMRFIYERATYVKAWLGAENSVIEPFLSSLTAYQFLPDELILEDLCQNSWSNPVMDGIIWIFSRPYWQRVWILQEIVCGSGTIVHCGRHKIPVDLLVRVYNLLASAVDGIRQPLLSVPKWTEAVNAGLPLGVIHRYQEKRSAVGKVGKGAVTDPGTDLLKLLRETENHQASDPRDKIFALLGIVEDIQWCADVFPIDYEVSVEELFVDAAMWIISMSERLDLLLIPQPLQVSSSKYVLPSWCPDWTLEEEMNSLTTLCNLEMSMRTDLWKPASVSFSSNPCSMTAQGILIDELDILMGRFDWNFMYWYQYLTLLSSGRLALEGDYSPEQLEYIRRWLNYLSQSNPLSLEDVPLESRENTAVEKTKDQRAILRVLQDKVPQISQDAAIDKPLEELCRTMVCDLGIDIGDSMLHIRSMFNVVFGWKDNANPDANARCLPPLITSARVSDELMSYTQPFRRWASKCTHGRQLAITKQGRMGMVPVTAKKGDSVCFLFGCQVPLVLRPEQAHFKLVGEAYLRRYMALEAVEEMQQGLLQEKTFVIH